MSADNGVYILQTSGPEFRVTYAQGIDNIYGKFDDDTLHWKGDMDSMMDYFGKSVVYKTFEEAFDFAQELSYNYDYLEYGICLISDFKELKFGMYD